MQCTVLYVIVGMLLTSSIWGNLADKHGRLTILRVASIFLLIFGLLTALAPTYTWIIFLRVLVGCYLSIIPQVRKKAL